MICSHRLASQRQVPLLGVFSAGSQHTQGVPFFPGFDIKLQEYWLLCGYCPLLGIEVCGIKISLFSPFRHDGLGDLKRWDMGRHLLFTSWSSCSRSPPCPCPWWEGAWRGYKLKYYYMTIDNLITNSGSQLCRYLPNVVHHLVWYGDFSIWNAKQLVYRHNLTPAPAKKKYICNHLTISERLAKTEFLELVFG